MIWEHHHLCRNNRNNKYKFVDVYQLIAKHTDEPTNDALNKGKGLTDGGFLSAVGTFFFGRVANEPKIL